MPRRAGRPCGSPGCPAVVRDGGYCEKHKKQEQKRYDRGRGTASQRGYGARWRRLRRAFLAAFPLCADPFGTHAEDGRIVSAIEVDHIRAKKRGGSDRRENLQALCRSCHSRKTAEVDGRWG